MGKHKSDKASIVLIVFSILLIILAIVNAIHSGLSHRPVDPVETDPNETESHEYVPVYHNDDYWEGWERGIDIGYDDGRSDGYSEGYSEAFYAGMIEGYSYGYEDGAAGREYDDGAVDQYYTIP